MKILLPNEVKIIINELNKNNFEAFAVGGCVRDSLLGIVPNDWDICTDATPAQMIKCFKKYKTFDSGIKHGTVSIVINNKVYEVTTYRIDGNYADNRRPDSVLFTKDIMTDLARRDFTVNAMAYNEKSGLVDPFSGRLDLKNKIIKCVNDPDTRFNEDALRILRALRFASVYNFKIDKETAAAVHKNAELLSHIASERIASEFNKLLCGNGAESILNDYRDVVAVFIPEIIPTFDYEQHTKHHNRDLWHHTTYSVISVENSLLLRMTMLLHDLGKPRACKCDDDGTCHYKPHPKYSAETAEIILKRLKYPADFIKTCVTLIKFHDVRFNSSKHRLRHVMNAIGSENVELLLKIQRADITAQSEYKHAEKIEKLNRACQSYNQILYDNDCFTLKQLNINGNDIKNIGVAQGDKIGKILKMLLSLVMEDKLENEKSALIKKAEEIRNIIQ